MITVVTIATIPAIIALVTIAKDLGMPPRLSPLLAIVLGIALSLFDGFIQGTVFDVAGALAVSGTGLILGLSASGLYDGASAVGKAQAKYGRHGAVESDKLF